jgi:hypothetical protein
MMTDMSREPERERADLIRRWGRWRRLEDAEARHAAAAWRHHLGVLQLVHLQRLRRHQVTDERGRSGCSLVGVVYDAERVCIYHTRVLMAEDIVHELLHAAHPSWSEAAVVRETERLLARGKVRRRATALRPALSRGQLVPRPASVDAAESPG